MKLNWVHLAPEEQASLSSLLLHHMPYMQKREVTSTVHSLGMMRVNGLTMEVLQALHDRVVKCVYKMNETDTVNLIGG